MGAPLGHEVLVAVAVPSNAGGRHASSNGRKDGMVDW